MECSELLRPDPEQSGRRRRRKGATSIEYVFMASLIIVACILAIQHVGSLTRGLFSTAANKTAVMNGSDR